MWLGDLQNGKALMVTQQLRIGIRGMAPGAKDERELGWFGWSLVRDISRDGHKIAFEEEGNGGGPNYTVFLRDTDGSPPVRIGEGMPAAISPDAKWVVTKPARGGNLSLVPTGAGESRQLTHDTVSYRAIRFLPDGKRLLAAGIEAGHGMRDYMIDVSSGDSKPITPEGVAGTHLSPDGSSAAVLGPDGKSGIWPLLNGSGIRPIPGLDSSEVLRHRLVPRRKIGIRQIQPIRADCQALQSGYLDRQDGTVENLWSRSRRGSHRNRRTHLFPRRLGLRLCLRTKPVERLRGHRTEVAFLS